MPKSKQLTLDDFVFLAFDEAAVPTPSRGLFYELRQDYYWICHPEHGLAFYRRHRSRYPQCNTSEEIQQVVLKQTGVGERLGFEVRKIDRVYAPVRLRGNDLDFDYQIPAAKAAGSR